MKMTSFRLCCLVVERNLSLLVERTLLLEKLLHIKPRLVDHFSLGYLEMPSCNYCSESEIFLPWNFLLISPHVSFARYQPPLPRDQVKPLAEFNYEGGKSVHWSVINHTHLDTHATSVLTSSLLIQKTLLLVVKEAVVDAVEEGLVVRMKYPCELLSDRCKLRST